MSENAEFRMQNSECRMQNAELAFPVGEGGPLAVDEVSNFENAECRNFYDGKVIE